MEPTRILLVGLPRLLEQIVADALAHAPDLALAGTLREPESLSAVAAATGADVVVLGIDDPALIATALARQPQLAVVVVSESARDSSLYVLRPERTRIGDLSPDSLVAAIRRAAQPVATWWAR